MRRRTCSRRCSMPRRARAASSSRATPSLLQPYIGAPARADSMLARLRELTRDNPIQQRGSTLSSCARVSDLRSSTRRSRSSAETTSDDAATEIARGPGPAYMIDVRRLIDALQAEEERALADPGARRDEGDPLGEPRADREHALRRPAGISRQSHIGSRARRARPALSEIETANERLQEQAVELEAQSEAAQAAAARSRAGDGERAGRARGRRGVGASSVAAAGGDRSVQQRALARRGRGA